MNRLFRTIDGLPVNFKALKFSGGEINVKIDTYAIPYGADITIHTSFTGSDDLIEMMILTDALRRSGRCRKISLRIPYLPYARQDRVMTDGESLSLKVITDLINSQNFDFVEVWDAHSDVAVALIDRVVNRSQQSLINTSNFFDTRTTVIVSPDAGAEKKIFKFAQEQGYDKVVTASKVRDVSTGQIKSTKLNDFPLFLTPPAFLIVDDICDGGRTFIELAKAIRNVSGGSINLLVTHGIFSKGIEVFDGLIDTVLVINNINDVESSEKTKVVTVYY